MIIAKTLVHKASMPIAEHAVRTFACTHWDKCILEIHSDGSLNSEEENKLLNAAGSMGVTIVRPVDRASLLEDRLKAFPLTRALVSRGGYFSKLELPITEETPFFYFDSDIVWLRPADSLKPLTQKSIFSTESWTWYYGMKNPNQWIRERVPRRVNSGFYFMNEEFPFTRMEGLLKEGLYDPAADCSTDQEIMAYLYPSMELYHHGDIMRSRRGRIYDLKNLDAIALHFPGRMWEPHLDQLSSFVPQIISQKIRRRKTKPLSFLEIGKMNFLQWIEQSPTAKIPISLYRKSRSLFRTS